MILFVFEGEKQEPRVFQTIKYLFFRNLPENDIQVSYCSNIHSLYDEMEQLNIFKEDVADIVTLLRNHQKKNPKGDQSLVNAKNYKFSQKFLFFDYDIRKQKRQNNKTLKEQNACITKMLEYFNDETDEGKLYINYPMIESIRYVKKLPDLNFYKYTSYVFLQGNFKKKAAKFSYYKDLRFIAFDFNSKTHEVKIPKDNSRIEDIKNNWLCIKDITVKKANYICTNKNELPAKKNEINQERIFLNQKEKYVHKLLKRVAILNSFPLFLYEYFDKQTSKY
jgi:hypothetical protein